MGLEEMATEGSRRSKPNIMVTGTPGTGKTTLSSQLANATKLRHVNIGQLVKERDLQRGYDDNFECAVMDEDRVCDEIEDMIEEGGNVVDYHGCDFFPEDWFDQVVVLRTENSILYDRLKKRGHSDVKMRNNLECEMFQMMLEEAKESFPEEMVVELRSDSHDDLKNNVETLADWVENWSGNFVSYHTGSPGC